MERVTRLFAYRKLRFVVVGIGNTLFNFAVLNFCFYLLHTSKIVSSIIATIAAVTLSFFLNRSFVFHHTGRSWRQPILFAAVTLSGVLLLQNSVYATSVYLLHGHTAGLSSFVYSFSGVRVAGDFLDINISNFIASLFSMLWNYNGYRLFVFREPEIHHETEAEAV